MGYVGRFAPSPTGPLHFGSAIAALASFLEAKSRDGQWFVRIDDIDPPREQSGATTQILRTLEALGLEWDGAVVYQGQRGALYEAALSKLATVGATFNCGCTRREVGAGPYPGTCRAGLAPGKTARSVRLRVNQADLEFNDAIQGRITQDLASMVGDYILRRADGLYAYHLANVVDDAEMEVSEVVRGVDLVDSTPRQIYLQSVLNLPQPRYAHLPLALHENGAKLSKQTFAESLDYRAASTILFDVLKFLNQQPPSALLGANKHEILSWARTNWRFTAIAPESKVYA